ncbi:hypothetical protein BBN63_32030 [Streptomyces niveus]|uniref:Uncharacterized protein n=1 Tax=Streptomyces niveus TaxID=193462 RepID=A0A1U9R1A4_STRNV|nr:hypothetical protein BBN63_32030 [Streptomyces niveus]
MPARALMRLHRKPDANSRSFVSDCLRTVHPSHLVTALVTAVAATATAAVLASTTHASAATTRHDDSPVVGHVRTVASFDYSDG